jgi:hypothetical protein
MKKIVLILLFFGAISYGQTKGISYQALITDPVVQQLPGFDNELAPLANKTICLKFSILDELGALEYEESFTITTNDVGMVNLIIGIGEGTITGGYAGSFEDIIWSTLAKNLKIELSPDESCSNFEIISNEAFTAVPFALFAMNAQDTPLVLDNEAEIKLLKALLAATQTGAGLNADGTYTPDASTNYISSVTSLKEADTALDSQVKNNEDAITANTTAVSDNTTNIGTNTTGIGTNMTDIGTNTSSIAINTTGIANNITDIVTNTSNIAANTTGVAANTSGIANNLIAITGNTTNVVTNTTDIANNISDIGTNTSSIATNTSGIANNVTDIDERVEISTIVNDLTTGGTTVPLSAEQGKVLKNLVATSVTIAVENSLTSTSTTNALSANQGRLLNGLVDTNATAITAETTRASAAESANAANIVAETTRASAAENTNAADTASETTRASAAESANAANIAAETTRASAAESTNAADIAAETTRASATESANAANIASETTRASAAENNNAADIASETTRASAAESANAANIAAETTRASAAESTNTTNIGTNTASNTGVVTVHSDVTNAGSGLIITDAERTKLTGTYLFNIAITGGAASEAISVVSLVLNGHLPAGTLVLASNTIIIAQTNSGTSLVSSAVPTDFDVDGSGSLESIMLNFLGGNPPLGARVSFLIVL